VSKEPGIYNLNMGFEGDLGLNEKPMAYGYLNGDSNNDIVTMSTGAKKELYIYTYDKDLFKFVRSNTVPLAAIGSNTVMSVILTDIDYDNKVDLVVTCINNDNSLNSTIYVFSKIGNDYVANNDYMIQNIRKQQPVVFTMYDNNKNSAVYTTYLLVQGNTDNVRACYYIDRNDNNKMTHRPFSELLNTKDTTHCLSQSNVDGFTLNPYLGSSFVDMNADCRPDLLFNSLGDGAQKQQEIYLYTNDGFCLVNVQSMPSQITMPSFLDLNNRGTNDMAFITQVNGNTNNIRVNVLRNKYTTDVNKGVLCTQNQINLENPYPGLKDIMQQNKGSDEWRYSYDLETNKYLYQDPENMATPPLALLGDLDLDGIMDLVLVETTENENNRSQARVVAYKGIKCSEDTAKIIFGKEVYTAEL